MVATLPTTWVPNHSPTAAEWAQVQTALTCATAMHNWTLFQNVSVSSTNVWTNLWSANITGRAKYGSASQSNLLVIMAMSWYVLAPPTAAEAGLQINGTIHAVCRLNVNDTNVHHTMWGVTTVTGLAAGYLTLMPQVQRIGGTGTVQTSNDDSGFFITLEIPI